MQIGGKNAVWRKDAFYAFRPPCLFSRLDHSPASQTSCEILAWTEPSTFMSHLIQMVKNRPAMWETWVQPLIQEDPLEKGMATHPSILS